MKEYLFSKEHNAWFPETESIQYSKCQDGIVVTRGSLIGSGFSPPGAGITLPEEIEGIPVVELRGEFPINNVNYIESMNLKRINIVLSSQHHIYNDQAILCQIPFICGGAQSTLEEMNITFRAPKMRLNECHSDSITSIIFDGTVVDNPDWDYGSFERSLFEGCSKLRFVSGRFKGHCLTGYTFKNCRVLTSFPDIEVQWIGDSEFENCFSLKKIHLRNGIKSLGWHVFQNCISLVDAYIPDTVERMGNGDFEGCSSLARVHLPKMLTDIPERLFAECKSLSKIYTPDQVQTIGNEAFYGCEVLMSPWIPETLRSIGERAFYGCKSMKKIYLPPQVTKIGTDAFANCPDLVIMGKNGSFCEQYAIANNIPFIAD